MLADHVKFSFDKKGEVTEAPYVGLFKVKVNLSLRESLRQEEVYRQAVGSNPEFASEFSRNVAAALSYLAVRIVQDKECPDWFIASNGLLDTKDINILVALNNEAMAAVDQEYAKLTAEAEKAQKELKKAAAEELK